MNLATSKLYRLRDPITGHFLHFTCLDQTTQDERRAWCGTSDMVKGAREKFPHLNRFEREEFKKQYAVRVGR